MGRAIRWATLVIALSAGGAAGQLAAPKPNKLVAGKLIYVAPMPQNLSQWIMDDLRLWGKYRLTTNAEGVDVVIDASFPERPSDLVMRGGIPQPRPRVEKPSSAER